MKHLKANDLQTLLLELKQDNESAFNRLYLAYGKLLYKKINWVVKNHSVADELLQDLFLKVWEKRQDIKPEQSFISFLHKVANNLVYDYFRKIAKNKRLHAYLLMNAMEHYLQTEEKLIEKETSAIIQNAIAKLSEPRRKVFQLCKIEGKSYQETAEILGITVSTVNSHMVNSIRFIKKCLYKNQEITTIIVISAIIKI